MDRVWIWFANNGNIRKWQASPFPEGTEYRRAKAEPSGAVAVRPLEWRAIGNGMFEAQLYQVWHQWLSDGLWHSSVKTSPSKVEIIGRGFRSLEEARAAAQADYEARIRSALATPLAVDQAMREATIAGWNACRKSIYAVCEDVSDEADRIRIKGPVGTHSEEQHAKGYHAGMHRAAKSIARGFNSMEAEDDDYLAAAIRRLAEGGDRD